MGMVLRRRISYHWRLFIPIALVMGVILAVLVWYQYRREADYRTEVMEKELAIINNRIIYAYERDISLRSFIKFIQQYYQGSMFDGVRVSVYDKDGLLMYSLGVPVPLDLDRLKYYKVSSGPAVASENPMDDGHGVLRNDEDKMFYYSGYKSGDGQITVRTAMPMTRDIHDEIDIDPKVWGVIIVAVVIALAIVWFSTRMLSRSITLLNDFAYRASTGGHFTGLDKFPHNELGDISREIIRMYRDRSNAIEQANHERSVAIHAIEEKARITRQITNNINHEIKTPVGIIRGYLETILDNPDLDEGTRNHFLSRMQDNVERLCSLLNDVSTMTRLEEGGKKVPLEMVDMHDLVYQINNDLPASQAAPGMRFSYDLPLDCRVVGNYNLLNGMFYGLIRNAAMHSGGDEISVKLVSKNDSYFIFSFADNGNGVGEEHLIHLFERFYRVDTGRSRKMGGTGLGLPIVKSTVLALGGTISVHNRSTGGLEFIFTLRKWDDNYHRKITAENEEDAPVDAAD